MKVTPIKIKKTPEWAIKKIMPDIPDHTIKEIMCDLETINEKLNDMEKKVTELERRNEYGLERYKETSNNK
jgi:hypothetical protein